MSRIGISLTTLNKLQTVRYRASEEKKQTFQTRTNLARISHKPQWSRAIKRQNRGNNQVGSSKERQKTKIFLGLDTTFIKVHQQPIQKDRQDEKTIEEGDPLGMDTRDKWRLRESEKRYNGSTVSGSLRPEERQLCDDRRLKHWSGGNIVTEGR